MSVAGLTDSELGTFAALLVKTNSLTLPAALDLCERITAGNVAAWADSYADQIYRETRDDIEREALEALTKPRLLLRHFGPLAYNMISQRGTFFPGDGSPAIENEDDATPIYDAIDKLEKTAKAHQAKLQETAKELGREQQRQAMPQEFPELETADASSLSGSKLAAKNIRTTLKREFPGIKFSIRTDYNSVKINWTNGPTTDAVKQFTNRHESGTFDGMTDCPGWNHTNVFGQVFGECRYVFESRKIDTGATETVARAYCDEQKMPFTSLTQSADRDGWHGRSVADIAHDAIGRTTIPTDHKISGIEFRLDEDSEHCGQWYATTEPKTEADAEPTGPFWTPKGALSTKAYPDFLRTFRKFETVLKECNKLNAAGHACEVKQLSGRRGQNYCIVKKADPETITLPANDKELAPPVPTREIDATAWL